MMPTIGRIVIYALQDQIGDNYWELPAIVTCVEDSHPRNEELLKVVPLPLTTVRREVHLQVFTPSPLGNMNRFNVRYSDLKQNGMYLSNTWHWPERTE